MAYEQSSSSNYSYLLNNKNRVENGEERYKSYLKNLLALISNSKESNTYEDECRTLLGHDSYILFTMAQVISQLTRHIQTMLSEDDCGRLLALYTLMSAKGNRDEVYHSNILHELGDAKCYRFHFEFSPSTGQLNMELLDNIDNPPSYVELYSLPTSKHAKWSQYIEDYLSANSPMTLKLEASKHGVFLKRNVRTTQNKNKSDDNKIHKENGLECRIALSNYKIFYVEHTEDLLIRKVKNTHKNKRGNVMEVLKKKKEYLRPSSLIEKEEEEKREEEKREEKRREEKKMDEMASQVLEKSGGEKDKNVHPTDAAIIAAAASNQSAAQEGDNSNGVDNVGITGDIHGAVNEANTALDNAIIQSSLIKDNK